VYNRTTSPYKWAGIQDNLGNVYQERLLGDKAQNLERALTCHKKALLVYTRKSHPTQWAITQSNLGAAYGKRILGEKAENLKKQSKYYNKALLVFTRESFPLDHAQTLYNLGITYKDSQQFHSAYTTFFAAIETVEFLRGLIVSEDYTTLTTAIKTIESEPVKILSEEEAGQEVKHKLAEEWNLLYQAMVEVCLELGDSEQAVEYVERSKTRNLVEFLAQNNSYSDFEFIRFPQILDVLPDDHTAIIEWYITPETFIVFIITRQTPYTIVWQPTLTKREVVLQALFDLGNEYLDDYEEGKKHWKDKLDNYLHRLALILHIDEILSLLPKSCDQLILIPYWFLHLFPLHALPLTNGEDKYLLDKFRRGVRYAPSCQLLQITKNQPRHKPTQDALLPHLFAIQNPTEDLSYANLEVQAICCYFQETKVLSKQKATKAALYQELAAQNFPSVNYVHFSCHAFFHPRFPLKGSAMFLADCTVSATSEELASGLYLTQEDSDTSVNLDKCLTLRDIFTLKLLQCCLVTLSACETGITDFYNISDEYISITSGFMYAGSSSIVSSLWGVDDISTALLMIRFYQNLQTASTVAIALNQAQTWLRDAMTEQLTEWASCLNLEQSLKQEIQSYLRNFDFDEQPFHNPYNWSAFCAIGH
jgi:CHAT domain-containing protein